MMKNVCGKYPKLYALCFVLMCFALSSCATAKAPPDFTPPALTPEKPEQSLGAETDELNQSGILLSFDDDYYTSWEAAFPLLAKFGARVTFFVQGNAGFCLRAIENGHSIGFHTKTHPDLRLLDLEKWREETIVSAENLKKAGITITAFAYPFGFFEEWMEQELLRHYHTLRGFGAKDRVYKIENGTLNNGVIVSKSIDNTVIKNDDDFFRVIDELLTQASSKNGIVVPLTSHNIDDNAQWGIRRDRLEYLLKKAVELGLRFLTYSDLSATNGSERRASY